MGNKEEMLVLLTVSVWRFNTRLKNIYKRMDKNNRKLNILHECINAKYQCHMAAYARRMSSTNAKKIEPHKTTYPSENGGLEKKKTGERAKSRKG